MKLPSSLDKMMLLTVIAIIFASGCSTAPIDGSARRPNRTFPAIIILKQIYQVNDDGSYTFGYEADDGTYRVENRDDSGYITGKYGYIDTTGSLQEVEYVAGKYGGRPIGYQAKSPSIPVISRDSQGVFPVLRPKSSSPEQKARDYDYNSVDENEDGIPDRPANKRNTISTTVRPASVAIAQKTANLQSYRSESNPASGTGNFQEIAADSSTIYETKVANREEDIAADANNKSGMEKTERPSAAVNAQIQDAIPQTVAEVRAPTLNANSFVDSTTIEPKMAQTPLTKDAELKEESVSFVDEKVGQQRGITTGKLEEFLRDLVARMKAKKTGGNQQQGSEQKPKTAPLLLQTAEDNAVNDDTMNFTRII